MKHIIKQEWYPVYIIEDTTKVTEKMDIPRELREEYKKVNDAFQELQDKLEKLYNTKWR